MNWIDPSGFEPAPDVDVGPGDFIQDYIYASPATEFNAPLSEQNFGPTDNVGTMTMPPGNGVWTPGSGQTGDVVPSEDTASFESCPFGRCAGPPRTASNTLLSEAARQVDDSAEFWETSLQIATILTPGPGMGEGLALLTVRAARASRFVSRGQTLAVVNAGVGDAVATRSAQAVAALRGEQLTTLSGLNTITGGGLQPGSIGVPRVLQGPVLLPAGQGARVFLPVVP